MGLIVGFQSDADLTQAWEPTESVESGAIMISRAVPRAKSPGH